MCDDGPQVYDDDPQVPEATFNALKSFLGINVDQEVTTRLYADTPDDLVRWDDVHGPCDDAPAEYGIRLHYWPNPYSISVCGHEDFYELPYVLDDEHPICWVPDIDLEERTMVLYDKETWEQRTRRILNV